MKHSRHALRYVDLHPELVDREPSAIAVIAGSCLAGACLALDVFLLVYVLVFLTEV